jgi:hypothetical protein
MYAPSRQYPEGLAIEHELVIFDGKRPILICSMLALYSQATHRKEA